LAKHSAVRSAAASATDIVAALETRSRSVRLAGLDTPAHGVGGARELQAQIASRIMGEPAGTYAPWSARRSLAFAVGGSAALWAVIIAGVVLVSS
jgi:hypothetical protein